MTADASRHALNLDSMALPHNTSLQVLTWKKPVSNNYLESIALLQNDKPVAAYTENACLKQRMELAEDYKLADAYMEKACV